MTAQPEVTKSELMQEIARSWTALQAALAQLSEDQLLLPRDASGWSVKDHVLHLAAWERSIIFLLQGRPRHAGLGVSEATYAHGSEEAINAAIFENTAAIAPQESLALLREVHAQLMAMLQPLSDEDLLQTYRHFLPDEEGEGDGPPVINVIYSNTAEHYAEHLPWIEKIVCQNR